MKTLLTLRSFAELVEDSLSACIGMLYSGCGFDVALDMPVIGATIGGTEFLKIRQIYARRGGALERGLRVLGLHQMARETVPRLA